MSQLPEHIWEYIDDNTTDYFASENSIYVSGRGVMNI